MTDTVQDLHVDITKWLYKNNFLYDSPKGQSAVILGYDLIKWHETGSQERLETLWRGLDPGGRVVLVDQAPDIVNWRDDCYRLIDDKVKTLKHVDNYVHFVLPFQTKAVVTVIDRR